jgi:hypothetical protein
MHQITNVSLPCASAGASTNSVVEHAAHRGRIEAVASRLETLGYQMVADGLQGETLCSKAPCELDGRPLLVGGQSVPRSPAHVATLSCLLVAAGVQALGDLATFELRDSQRDFGPSKFGRWGKEATYFEGRHVDIFMRALPVKLDADPVEAVRTYLRTGGTTTQRMLARKAVVMLEPDYLLGEIVWPEE